MALSTLSIERQLYKVCTDDFCENYNGIIGSSQVMSNVFRLVDRVAATQSSVLILGETGTGKELIAKAIHDNSTRSSKPFVKLNCAALPANLIESELFGHERGSFTGAHNRRIGKFEAAHNGTLFLDEIGDMPLELQVKLLRALQEKEIERLGGQATIKTDVRIIAATNRNLEKDIQDGNFRSDLYFRLNVFPILMPPLRDRRDDIPLLANFFIKKIWGKTTKSPQLSKKAVKQLVAYNWPGNVRELENLIERTLVLNDAPVISIISLPHIPVITGVTADDINDVKTIDEVERTHILTVLRLSNGKISGPGGAATKLDIPSTTLFSKMRKLKIKKGYYEN